MTGMYEGSRLVEFCTSGEDTIKEIASYSHLTVDELCKKINSIVQESNEHRGTKEEPKNSVRMGEVVYDLDNPEDIAKLKYLEDINQRICRIEYGKRRQSCIRQKKISTICLIIGCIAAVVAIICCLN